jgi:molybdopterin synthase catalytic subunit
VRDHDGGRDVVELEYSAHPDAERALRRVAEAVAADLPVHGLAAAHRTGLLRVGDVAVVVAASASHRGQAFEAARRLIDDLKATVPIWKRQVFRDGDEEWVGTP